jgi:excisionase family DNA binding protein
MDNLSSFLNVKWVSEYLVFKASTVYSLVEEKKIPHYRIGRQIRFKKSEIDEWMAGQKEPVVDAMVVARKVIGSLQKRSNPRIKRTIRKIIEEVKGGGYTVGNGKPDQIKGLGKEVSDGTI